MNSWECNKAAHQAYYTEQLGKFGTEIGSVGWSNEQSQLVRFRVLSEVGIMPETSVLDVGCGLGDLYGYLESLFKAPPHYIGVDVTPRMIETAQAKYPSGKFLVHDILDPGASALEADFVFASGIFALLDLEQDPYGIMRRLIQAMFRRCRAGIAFNSLSSWTPNPEPGKFFVDPVKALALCHDITPWLSLRHDYMPHDFTVYMYKDQQRTRK
jgi:SAM-dependent methyltransferase